MVKIEPRPVVAHVITTSTFVCRWLERNGMRDDELSAAEFCRLFQRASAAADRFNRMFPADRAQSSIVQGASS